MTQRLIMVVVLVALVLSRTTAPVDPEETVRQAAGEALRAIRFYHEQKAHWDRAFQGLQVSANSAAEALIQQADPKEKKVTRLLAIRSLGLLGKVETLPFLINYSKEEDPEIRAEALKAIRTAQERAMRATGESK